ncbi:TPA: CPBP family intramembrane glutamic endopeptidase [Serratia marcescens]|uniref:CPBP family intramembrane glutamic endopeptidase n=1 Tax=Serratia nevei TaxID=2703794 RepID=UPI0011F33C12|nr:type II CAAX endopeptidase family protein [Serratia nevei]HEJ7857781.1 CPBP family intramembrane metalloprotease [Serratia marcescens]
MNYDEEYIKRYKDVSGCLLVTLILFGTPYVTNTFSFTSRLISNGVFYSLFFIEFAIIVPLYLLFFIKRHGFGKGNIQAVDFILFMLLIVCIQFLLLPLMGVDDEKPAGIFDFSAYTPNVIGMLLSTVFLAPIYEEMVFRGCFFKLIQHWFNNDIAAIILTSGAFVIFHSQYDDYRILIALFLVSIVFGIARQKSDGIVLPMFLHISMNLLVIYF